MLLRSRSYFSTSYYSMGIHYFWLSAINAKMPAFVFVTAISWVEDFWLNNLKNASDFFQQKYMFILQFLLQDEFLDVIYWLRQIIAVILGVIWGVAPLKGFLGIAM